MEQKAKRKAQMSKNKAIHCQDDGFRYLVARVLQQSKRDLLGSDLLAALDALSWWLFGDGYLWADALGLYMSPYRVLRWVVGGLGDDERSEIDRRTAGGNKGNDTI